MSKETSKQIGLSTLSLLAFVLLSACEVKVEDANGVIKINTTDVNDPTWVDADQLICRDKSNANVFTEIVISKLHVAYTTNSLTSIPCADEDGNIGGCINPPENYDSKTRAVIIKKFDLNNGTEDGLFSATITEKEKSYGLLLSEGSTAVKLIEDSNSQAILVRNGIISSFSCSDSGRETHIFGPTADYFYCNSKDGKYVVSLYTNVPQIQYATAQSKSLTIAAPTTQKVYSIYVYNNNTNENSVSDNNVREINPQSVSFTSSQLRLKASRSLDENSSFYGTLELKDSLIELSCNNGYGNQPMTQEATSAANPE